MYIDASFVSIKIGLMKLDLDNNGMKVFILGKGDA